jgi:2-oxoglutarate/2-oxoacid ferredoxin oxidoreductase subunit alpha
VCTTSGPGMALKGEALGLAVMTELPLVVIDVQRGGPSTGLPTKTEQSDLMQAMYGRNGEAPLCVVAACTPADCFDITPDIPVHFRTDPSGFLAYKRDPDTLAREWVRPGTPGLEHRIGGIEKQDLTGNVNYEPLNHERMCKLRAEKIARIKVPDLEVYGDTGDLLVLGWGSTFGAIRSAVDAARARGLRVGHAHLRHLNPMPANTGEVLRSFRRVLVPEMNLGQLVRILRAEYLVDCISLPKIQGQAFKVSEILDAIHRLQHTEAAK